MRSAAGGARGRGSTNSTMKCKLMSLKSVLTMKEIGGDSLQTLHIPTTLFPSHLGTHRNAPFSIDPATQRAPVLDLAPQSGRHSPVKCPSARAAYRRACRARARFAKGFRVNCALLASISTTSITAATAASYQRCTYVGLCAGDVCTDRC